MSQDKKPILLFELGNLQVFHYQTMDEWTRQSPITEVYWQKKGENIVRGPFASAYIAVNDYSAYIDAVAKTKDLDNSNVIHVDFKNKKKIK